MSIHFRPTVAEIDLDSLRHNVKEVQKRIAPNTKIIAVVKANAYGHGALMCVRAIKGLGVDSLAVATLEEGIELRGGGIKGEIFILNGLLAPSVKEFVAFRLKPVIHHIDELNRLVSFLKEGDKPFPIHLKIDTGMGRLGFFAHQIDEILPILKKCSPIKVEALLTHLARADEDDQEPTKRQFVLFDKLKKIYEERGLNVPLYHMANSAAIIDGQSESSSFVRPGIMLYGAYPHSRHVNKIDIKQVMTLKTKIISLKKHKAQSSISYGGTFLTKRESLIAAIPVGYADGYPRLLSNRGFVLVGGIKVPIVGRVCMDLTMIDVTDVPNVNMHDEVVLMGSQRKEIIRAEEIAAWAETISYEIFCGITARVPRVYIGM